MTSKEDFMQVLHKTYQDTMFVLHEKYMLVKSEINSRLSGFEPFEILIGTLIITAIVCRVLFLISIQEDFIKLLKKRVFRFFMNLPIIRGYVKNELDKVNNSVRDELLKHFEGEPFKLALPNKGWTPDKICKEIHLYNKFTKIDWQSGRASGAIYCDDTSMNGELSRLMKEVYGITAYTNPLHPDLFPGIRKMEAEIVRMTLNLFKGNEETCGCVTSGGTESIILACKAYRDYARYERGIRNPEMLVPVTAHAAFEKAASLCRMKIVFVPVDPITMKVDLKRMKRAINGNTCMLVASSPQFPHGIVDPVEDIAKLGLKYNVPVHVDACLGGFLLPFMEKAGFPQPKADFSVPGVTSISADTHKYAYAPKGSSVIMYRNVQFRHYQFFVQTDWPGGIYASPTISGSRAGAIIATCWSAMLFHGLEGYVESTRKILATTQYLKQELAKIPGLFIFGDPEMSVIALGSKHFNIFRLSDALTERKWSLNTLQFPSGFHICVTLKHTQPGVAESLVKDIREICTALVTEPPETKATGSGAIYGMAQRIPDRSIVEDLAHFYLDACYATIGSPSKPNSNGATTNRLNGGGDSARNGATPNGKAAS